MPLKSPPSTSHAPSRLSHAHDAHSSVHPAFTPRPLSHLSHAHLSLKPRPGPFLPASALASRTSPRRPRSGLVFPPSQFRFPPYRFRRRPVTRLLRRKSGGPGAVGKMAAVDIRGKRCCSTFFFSDGGKLTGCPVSATRVGLFCCL